MKKQPDTLICRLLCLSMGLALLGAHPSGALPTLVSRATDSLSALLTSGRSSNNHSNANSQPTAVASGEPATGSRSEHSGTLTLGAAQRQDPTPGSLTPVASAPSSADPGLGPASAQAPSPSQSQAPLSPSALLQAHLSAMQAQAQRQISQLNGLVLNSPLAIHAANLTNNKYGNVLEVLSNVGKAIQQQIGAPSGIQIITSPSSSATNELANTKKNEYQSIGDSPGQPVALGQQASSNSSNYREQGEQLRQDIVRRAGQLQQVVASSLEMLKSNGDLIVRRLLEQLNSRLDQAKSKADKIISEPATNDVAIKALNAINQGLNNLNNIITNIVNRLDMGTKDQAGQQLARPPAQRVASPASPLLDPTRIKLNLQQLSQQFSSAINAAARQQQQQAQPQPALGQQALPVLN